MDRGLVGRNAGAGVSCYVAGIALVMVLAFINDATDTVTPQTDVSIQDGNEEIQ